MVLRKVTNMVSVSSYYAIKIIFESQNSSDKDFSVALDDFLFPSFINFS